MRRLSRERQAQGQGTAGSPEGSWTGAAPGNAVHPGRSCCLPVASPAPLLEHGAQTGTPQAVHSLSTSLLSTYYIPCIQQETTETDVLLTERRTAEAGQAGTRRMRQGRDCVGWRGGMGPWEGRGTRSGRPRQDNPWASRARPS